MGLVLRIAETILSKPKPKLIKERQVRIQAIRVRSAASRLRCFANSSVIDIAADIDWKLFYIIIAFLVA